MDLHAQPSLSTVTGPTSSPISNTIPQPAGVAATTTAASFVFFLASSVDGKKVQSMPAYSSASGEVANVDAHSLSSVVGVNGSSSRTLLLWAAVSQILWWTVLIVSLCSLPILAFTLRNMFRKHRKSVYFHFLTTMTIINMLMLVTIIFNLLADDYASSGSSTLTVLKGNFTCKLTVFLTNMLSCYSNWLWVMMFGQRFAYVFFPVQRQKFILRALEDSKALILGTGLISAFTQFWTPILMTQVVVGDTIGDGIEGSYCGADHSLVGHNTFKWIAVIESMWTYAIPFCITLCTDIAVLVFANESKRFVILPSSMSHSLRGWSGCRSGAAATVNGSTTTTTSLLGALEQPLNASNVLPNISIPSEIERLPLKPPSISLNDNDDCPIAKKTNSLVSRACENNNNSNHKHHQLQLSNIKSQLFKHRPRSVSNCCNGAAGNMAKVSDAGGGRSPRSTIDGGAVGCGSIGDIGRLNSVIVISVKRSSTNSGIADGGTVVSGKKYSSAKLANAAAVATASAGLQQQQPLLKIQTETRLRRYMARRQHAIRRCLAIASMQLCLNLPNYILQLVDEFSDLRNTSERYMEFYLWADALCYMLYLSQYPMLAVYVSWFHPGLGAYSALKKTHQHEAGGGAVPSSVSLPTTFGFDGVKTDASLLVKNNNAPSIQGPKVSVGGGADSFMRRFGDDQRTNARPFQKTSAASLDHTEQLLKLSQRKMNKMPNIKQHSVLNLGTGLT